MTEGIIKRCLMVRSHDRISVRLEHERMRLEATGGGGG